MQTSLIMSFDPLRSLLPPQLRRNPRPRPLLQDSPQPARYASETRLPPSRRPPSSNLHQSSSPASSFDHSPLPSLEVSHPPTSLELSPHQSNRSVPSVLVVQLPPLQQQSAPLSLSTPSTLEELSKPPSDMVSAPLTPKSDSCRANQAIDGSATNGGKLDHPSLPVQLLAPPQLSLLYQSPKTLLILLARRPRPRGGIEPSRWRSLPRRWARGRNERRRTSLRGRPFFLGQVETLSGTDRRKTWLGRIRG